MIFLFDGASVCRTHFFLTKTTNREAAEFGSGHGGEHFFWQSGQLFAIALGQ